MHVDQKFKRQTAERGTCALYVENSLMGHFVVGGTDQEMIDRVASYLNALCAKPGTKPVRTNLPYEPGDNFDTLIAQRVFEWIVEVGPITESNPRGLYCTNPRVQDDWHDLPYFSKNLADAWTVMEHMVRRAERTANGKLGSEEWRRFVGYMQGIQLWHLEAGEAAFMICICAAETLKRRSDAISPTTNSR